MPELEMLKFALQFGMGGVFFWLWWQDHQELKASNARHDAEIERLWTQRVNELKLMAKLPTDLDGSRPANMQPGY